MGCQHSLPDDHPNMFKARNLNDKDKTVNSVVLEVQNSNIIVHSRTRKVMAKWPIACLRRYGCTRDVLFIEAGSGCDTGHGMYLFKSTRAEQLFELLKRYWAELEAQHQRTLAVNSPLTNFTHADPLRVATDAANGSGPNYVNSAANSSRHHYVITNSGEVVYSNDDVPRGSTSSQHLTAPTLASLPENSTLSYESATTTFALQPAPATREEMRNRRRIQSDLVASYNRTQDQVHLDMTTSSSSAASRRRSEANVNYENDLDGQRTSAASVRYEARTQRADVTTTTMLGSRLASPDELIASQSRDPSMASLRSDCEPLLTPGSNSTSGVGSLNGNSLPPPPPLPPHPAQHACGDPWHRRHRGYVVTTTSSSHRSSPAGAGHGAAACPHSAREYVNTFNASLDVSGTPLPATAATAMHFNFDFFDVGHLGVGVKRPRSVGSDRQQQQQQRQLNYVPVEVLKGVVDGGVADVGTSSSASSGIPGTPRTPKTPLVTNGGGGFGIGEPPTDYAVIDHRKTRALSKTHSKRQRERKSRHESSETNATMT